MRKFFLMVVFASIFCGSSIAQVAVTLTSPKTFQNLPTTVSIAASARSSRAITGWWIYVDNKGSWHNSTDTASISAAIPMTAGAHTVRVRAWDSSGAFGDSTFTATVGDVSKSTSSTSVSSSALPVPPSTAKVLPNLEESATDWSMCTAPCAGGRESVSYSTSLTGWPVLDGKSREFFNGGGPYSNALFVRRNLGQQNYAHNFIWDFYVYLDQNTASSIYNLEYDLWQSQSGYEYMAGSQAHYPNGTGKPGHWDTWDQLNRHWIHNYDKVAPRFAANTWHHVQWYMQRDESRHTYTYKTLVIDGGTPQEQVIVFNQTQSGAPINWADSFGVQWQLDLNKDGIDAREYVDKVKVTVW